MNFILPKLATKDSKLQTLKSSASLTMTAFTKALSNLAIVNEKIQQELLSAEEEIKSLKNFSKELEVQKTHNQKIIDNINILLT